MSQIPFAGVENDYRREQITKSFRDHKKTRRHLFHRKPREEAAAVDWFGE